MYKIKIVGCINFLCNWHTQFWFHFVNFGLNKFGSEEFEAIKHTKFSVVWCNKLVIMHLFHSLVSNCGHKELMKCNQYLAQGTISSTGESTGKFGFSLKGST